MLSDLLLKDFLNETASKNPVPGGGSIAALAASISAALSEMVANLTTGKKKYEQVQSEMASVSKDMKIAREKFISYIDKDADAYKEVMNAYKNDPADGKTNRDEAIQISLKNAAEIPLKVASDAFKLMEAGETVLKSGNRNAMTDALVAVMMARTAVLSALYNVKINLQSIDDKNYTSKTGKRVKELEAQAKKKEMDVLEQYGI